MALVHLELWDAPTWVRVCNALEHHHVPHVVVDHGVFVSEADAADAWDAVAGIEPSGLAALRVPGHAAAVGA